MPIYKTSDLHLASFLCAKGLLFKSIDSWNGNQRCNFTLTVPEEIDLIRVLKEWDNSSSEFIKIILLHHKRLKTELTKFVRGEI